MFLRAFKNRVKSDLDKSETTVAPLPTNYEAEKGIQAMSQQEDPGPENRQSTRRPLETEIDFGGDSQFFTGFTKNISAGGLFVATHEELEMGSTIRIKFGIPAIQREFDFMAEVRWHRPYRETQPTVPAGYGVCFVNISQDDQTVLDSYLETAETLFFDDEDL
jgi:uncharacterized protein (TIGR02266 family)